MGKRNTIQRLCKSTSPPAEMRYNDPSGEWKYSDQVSQSHIRYQTYYRTQSHLQLEIKS